MKIRKRREIPDYFSKSGVSNFNAEINKFI